jgi:hypothetical protein
VIRAWTYTETSRNQVAIKKTRSRDSCRLAFISRVSCEKRKRTSMCYVTNKMSSKTVQHFLGWNQGRIKGFVGPMHFSSEGPFGNWKSIVATTVHSRLPGLMEGDGMHSYLRNTDNPNFIFYTPTAPLATFRLRNMLFSHTSHLTGRPIVEFWFFKTLYFWSLVFCFYQFSNFFHSFTFIFFFLFLRRP